MLYLLYYLYICFLLCAVLFCAAKEVTPLFKWFDVWVGFFWDAKKRWLYFLPLPTIGFIFKFCLLLFLFTSCGEILKDRKELKTDQNNTPYLVTTIDKCEYIVTESSSYGGWTISSLTHKGNCKNPIHIYK